MTLGPACRVCWRVRAPPVCSGISLALNALPISLYITFLLASLAEIPSNVAAAWGIERIGRHNTLAAGMLLGGVACLICSFSKGGAQAFFAAVGKLGVAGAFTVASIYTSGAWASGGGSRQGVTQPTTPR